MAIEKNTTFSGTVEAFEMFRKFEIEKGLKEHIEGNKRWQEATGGLEVTVTFDAAGEEQQVSATVQPAQVASMTLQQILDVAAVKLAAKLGV